MKLHKTFSIALVALACLIASAPSPVRAADRMDELKAKFEQRFPKLRQLKSAGKIGETASGTVDAVQGGLDEESQKLLADENADRTELYNLIAQKENTTPALVAERNAARNFQKASSGEYLKDKSGQWQRKK